MKARRRTGLQRMSITLGLFLFVAATWRFAARWIGSGASARRVAPPAERGLTALWDSPADTANLDRVAARDPELAQPGGEPAGPPTHIADRPPAQDEGPVGQQEGATPFASGVRGRTRRGRRTGALIALTAIFGLAAVTWGVLHIHSVSAAVSRSTKSAGSLSALAPRPSAQDATLPRARRVQRTATPSSSWIVSAPKSRESSSRTASRRASVVTSGSRTVSKHQSTKTSTARTVPQSASAAASGKSALAYLHARSTARHVLAVGSRRPARLPSGWARVDAPNRALNAYGSPEVRRAHTTTLTTGVAKPGIYHVAVSLSEPTRRGRSVHVLVGPIWRTAHVDASGHGLLRLALRIHGRTLTVRALGERARPKVALQVLALGAPSKKTVAPPVVTPAPPAPVPAAVASSPVPVGASGVSMPVGNLPGWNQIYSNDFTQTVALGNPASVFGFSDYGVMGDTSGNGLRDTADTVSEGGGLLDVWVHTNSSGQHLAATLLPVGNGVTQDHGQLYGTYSFRMRADPVAGYKFVFILWPDSGRWPGDGEIDFPEADLTATAIGGATHYQGGSNGNDQDWWATPGYNFQQWHTYTIQWTASALSYFIDGTLTHTTSTRVPNTPMHPVIQVETVTDGSPAPSGSAQGHVQFDSLVAYAPAP